MKKLLPVLALMLALLIIVSACDVSISTSGASGSPTVSTSGNPQFGKQTKTSNCAAHDGLPDSACTPGAIFTDVTTTQVCKSGYASSVRNVPTSEKDQVYA